jgi:hypothetical protein
VIGSSRAEFIVCCSKAVVQGVYVMICRSSLAVYSGAILLMMLGCSLASAIPAPLKSGVVYAGVDSEGNAFIQLSDIVPEAGCANNYSYF